MAARTVGSECGPAFMIEKCFGHNGTGGIAGAEKKYVVAVRHELHPFAGLAGTQQATSVGPSCAGGFLARMKALANFPSTWGAIASTSIPSSQQTCPPS